MRPGATELDIAKGSRAGEPDRCRYWADDPGPAVRKLAHDETEAVSAGERAARQAAWERDRSPLPLRRPWSVSPAGEVVSAEELGAPRRAGWPTLA